MTRALLAPALALLASACSISSIDDESTEAPRDNTCESSDDCGSGSCSRGLCVSHAGTHSALLLEVTTSAEDGAVRYLRTITGLSPAGGALDLALDELSAIDGVVTYTAPYECSLAGRGSADGAALPARITLQPSARTLGLPSQAYTVEADAEGRFHFDIPPGDYDVYVEPHGTASSNVGPSGDCPLAPQLYRGRHFEAGPLALPIELARPELLAVHLARTADSQIALDGFTLDLVDTHTGRALSEPVTVGSGGPDGYDATIAYLPVVGDPGGMGKEFVRLRPPKGLVAPTLVWERGAVELLAPGQAVLGDLGKLPPAVSFEAVVASPLAEPVPGAAVTIVATSLDGLPPGTLASYTVRGQMTDADGRIAVALLPGTYRVLAEPASGSGLAALESEWVVSSAPVQAGHELSLTRAASITGNVDAGWSQGDLSGAVVQAVASTSDLDQSVLDAVLDRVAFVPRAASGVLFESGSFAVAADHAVFDLSVRPRADSGFAWFVRPNVAVAADATQVSLGHLALPLPVAYIGAVSSSAGLSHGGALLRAFLFMDASRNFVNDPAAARTVVQVAETRADAEGRYQLLLPEALEAQL